MHATVSSDPSVQQIQSALSANLGGPRFDRYFVNDTRLDITGGTLRVRVKDQFYAKWLSNKFEGDLKLATRQAIGLEDCAIDWVVDPEAFGEHNQPATAADPAPPEHDQKRSRPISAKRSRASFWKNPPLKGALDDFIVGTCNRLAYQAATRVAQGDHSVEFSLLFLHGECGVGKTHLLQGIADQFRINRPGSRVRYVTGEAFTNMYISAIRSNTMARFREQFRDLDLLCIDDVHFISGKNGTQSECLHTLDELDLQGARIVLASDEHPRRVAKLDHRLLSRLLSGMIVAMDRPDEQTRRAMVTRFAASRGISLEPAALGMLAERCAGSARDIIGAVTHIEALLKLLPDSPGVGRAVSPAVVDRAMGELQVSRPTRPLRVQEIARTVCAELLVDLSEMLGSSRHRRVVLARSVTSHLARQLTTQSYPEIATQMHRTNHSTIVTACQRIDRMIKAGERVEDPLSSEPRPLAEVVERLRSAVLRESALASNA